MENQILVPYQAVFSDGSATFDHFKRIVKSLSRTDALFWCARLNLILGDPNLDSRTKQQHFLDMFFTPQQIGSLNRFVDGHGGADHVVVVHRGTVLELIRWICLLCSDNPADGDTFDQPHVRETFARALLMANDFWGQRVYGIFPFKGTSIDERREDALAPIRHSMSETRYHIRLFDAVARGSMLFGQIFPRYHGSFCFEFHENTGLSIDEYYRCLCMLMAHCLNSDTKSGIGGKEQPGIFTLKNISDPAPHLEELFRKFLNGLSITPEELATALWSDERKEPAEFNGNYSLRPLRQRPVLRAKDGRMIILDPVCFIEKASVGPLFHILTEANQNNLFSEFGYAFEAYVDNILQHIYPDPGPYLAKRLFSNVREVRNPDGIQVADFVVDNVSDIIVIEAKAVWIQDAKISDHNAFVKHLRIRYGGEGTLKGYKQLARNVGKISMREWHPVGIDLTKAKHIFPVLLVHDSLLDAPVFGHFLAKEFGYSLEPESIDMGSWMVKGDFRVAPLIVMTIDDLECLDSSLNNFTLASLLRAYSASTPERLMSLSKFLSINSKDFPITRSHTLALSWNEIVQNSMQLFSSRS